MDTRTPPSSPEAKMAGASTDVRFVRYGVHVLFAPQPTRRAVSRLPAPVRIPLGGGRGRIAVSADEDDNDAPIAQHLFVSIHVE